MERRGNIGHANGGTAGRLIPGARRKLAQERRRGHDVKRMQEELLQLHIDVTAMIAHEISSPVAAIRGLAAMVVDGDLAPQAKDEVIAGIQAEAALVARLLDDLRRVGSVDRDDWVVPLRAVPIRNVMSGAVAFARALPGNHPVSAVIETDPNVRADPLRIGQVLRNLLSNAARYSPPGAGIELRAFERAKRMHVEIADRGEGIDPDDVHRIFEKYGRGRRARDDKSGGFGLGLYVARRILACHDSALRVESTPGLGSVFGFDLEIVR